MNGEARSSGAIRDALLKGRRRPRRNAQGSPLQQRGDGYEFVELREYVPGDDVRRIDWAATARSARLQTRVMLEDVALTLAVWIDDSPSMGCGRTRPLCRAAHEIGDAWLAAALRTDRARVLGSLEEAIALPRGAALLAVSDDRLLTGNRGLAGELGRRLDCTALIARDPWQQDLPLSGFVRVADVTNGRSAQLFIGKRERERYRAASISREARVIELLQTANWRTGTFTEDEGATALRRALGVP